MPSSTTVSKLHTWGCPACGGYGEFHEVMDYDQIVCDKCNTAFSGIFLAKWDGKPHPQMIGTKPSGLASFGGVPAENEYDPVLESSMGSKLIALLEKVVRFREAVVNPDRVTTDEEVEELLKTVFEVSYTLPTPSEIEEEVTKDTLEDVDLAPDTYESATAYAAQLDHAVKAGILTAEQAGDLFRAFGGDDPFESLPPVQEISPDEVSKVPKITNIHDSVLVEGLNFEEAEAAALDWIDPWGN